MPCIMFLIQSGVDPMTPAGNLRAQELRKSFAEEVAKPEDLIRLELAALLIAAEDKANLETDIVSYLSQLETWAGLARDYISRSSITTPINAFNRFMFEELGFKGNQANYYDPRNSFLNEVMDRRTGIPITLSVVYMQVGRGAGLHVEGVPMPGHFIVRVKESDSPCATLVDPFHTKIIDLEDCQERLDEAYGGQVALTEEHLHAATTREILVRILTNLKAIYARHDLYRQALAAVERILLLSPRLANERRDRAAILAQLNHLPEAITELEAYLRSAPNTSDADQVREHLRTLRLRQASRN